MSLRDAVQEIVKEMEVEFNSHKPGDMMSTVALRVYASQLKTALKASEGEKVHLVQGGIQPDAIPQGGKWHSQAYNPEAVSKVKATAEWEDTDGGVFFAVCVGGAEDGTSVRVPADVPEGAKRMVSGTLYEFRQGKLHWVRT